jgi:hypothetical protein
MTVHQALDVCQRLFSLVTNIGTTDTAAAESLLFTAQPAAKTESGAGLLK